MKECDEIMKLFNKLIDSQSYPFPKRGIRIDVTRKHGVYIIYNPNGKIMHVGRTLTAENGLNQRIQNHLTGTSSFRKEYLKPNGIDLRNRCGFKYIEVANARKRAFLEALSIGLLCPDHIGTGIN